MNVGHDVTDGQCTQIISPTTERGPARTQTVHGGLFGVTTTDWIRRTRVVSSGFGQGCGMLHRSVRQSGGVPLWLSESADIRSDHAAIPAVAGRCGCPWSASRHGPVRVPLKR
ncbi:hypothetical protein GCM10027280_24660 [Micromonospora polyrhachis]